MELALLHVLIINMQMQINTVLIITYLERISVIAKQAQSLELYLRVPFAKTVII